LIEGSHRLMLAVFLGISLMAWGFICLLIAAIYMIFYPHPKKVTHTDSYRKGRYVILRWFHSIVWLLLGISCFMWGDYIPGKTVLANILALLSLLIYVIFVVTIAMERKAQRRA
jgi:hypothetical protein